MIDNNESSKIENSLHFMLTEFMKSRDSGELIRAAVIGEKVVNTFNVDAVVWFDYGRVLYSLGLLDKSIFCFKKAISMDSCMIIAIIFLGNAILDRCCWHENWAMAGFKEAPWSKKWFCDDSSIFSIDNSSVLIAEVYNIGVDLSNSGYFDEAIICFKLITKICPGFNQAFYALSVSLLSLGRFDEAVYPIIEWKRRSEKNFDVPYWGGEDIFDKVMYVYSDHGLGDIIQFIRYISMASKICKKVIVYIPDSLRKIIGYVDGVEFVAEINQEFDVMCSLFVLPHVIGIDKYQYSFTKAYLSVDQEKIDFWSGRLPEAPFRIGIAWQGNPNSSFDQGRSIPLSYYAPLAKIPGVRLISLQLIHGLDQLKTLPGGMEVTTLGPDFNAGPDNFVDTAAVMKNMDLIISTDTSVAHLAGALGCPVWVLLKAVPDWRWMLEREDSPWYPTMRLFRQKTIGDWRGVMMRVVEALVDTLIEREKISSNSI